MNKFSLRVTVCFCFFLSLLPVFAVAPPQLQYATNTDNTLTVVACINLGSTITIPDATNGMAVTVIGPGAFQNSISLTTVTLGTNVADIETSAFFGCPNLTAISLPAGLTNIGPNAFSATGIGFIAIPGGVKTIGASAFASSQLNSLILNSGLTDIGQSAFQATKLFSLSLPGTVTNIEAFAFSSCTFLTSVAFPSSLTSIGDYAFDMTALSSVTIPGTVTNLGIGVFANTSALTSVTISPGVPYIGTQDFQSSGVSTVTIPGSVTNIGTAAFNGCQHLSSVSFAPGLRSIGALAFAVNSALTSIALPDTVTVLNSQAFSSCTHLTNIALGSSLADIESSAFGGCALTEIYIPGTVTNLGGSAFANNTGLATVIFGGDAPPDNSSFSSDPATVYVFAGTTGWGSTFAGLPVITIDPPSGSLEVTTTAGGRWQVDGGALQNSGAVVSGLGLGMHNVAFAPVAGYVTPASELVNVYAGQTSVTNGNYIAEGSLTVTLLPAAAATDGARWAVDGGTSQLSGTTLSNLGAGQHTVSFIGTSAWTNPPNQTVTIVASNLTTATGNFLPASTPATGLILLTNGFGSIQHKAFPLKLVVGQSYTVKAVPGPGNVSLFENWTGGSNQPFGVLSTNASYTFTMESNLVLEANFVTNIFLAGQGNYLGLFVGIGGRGQTNSGAFGFSLNASGTLSGKLLLGSQTIPLAGKFASDGSATIASTTRNGPEFTTTLQLDVPDQAVNGVVSNQNFTATLSGFQAAFSAKNKATGFSGHYTVILPGTNDPSIGPFGVSYGTLNISSSGAVTFAGSLADGTPVSQSTAISAGGLWPLYIPLYNGQGSLWAWNLVTNGTVSPLPWVSWINATNGSKSAVYRAGFTNQFAGLIGEAYVSTNQPLLNMTNGIVVLADKTSAIVITNSIALSANNKITFTNTTEDTNKLMLAINKATGIINGSFANPSNPKQTIKVNGVLLQGSTNAQGYFLETNQSGALLLQAQ